MNDGIVSCRNNSTRDIEIHDKTYRDRVYNILKRSEGDGIVYDVYNDQCRTLMVDINTGRSKEFLEWVNLILISYGIVMNYIYSEPKTMDDRYGSYCTQ